MASGDTLPTLTTLPEFLPDPLRDSNRLRATKTNRRKGYGMGLWPRLLIGGEHELQHVTSALWRGPAADLYDHDKNRRAREMVAAIVGPAPTWAKLERGLEGMIHAHIVTTKNAPLLLPAGSVIEDVYDLEGLARYLAKPSDARACMPRQKRNGQTFTLPADPEKQLEAYIDFMHARRAAGGRRFPRNSWTLNLPRLVADLADEQTG